MTDPAAANRAAELIAAGVPKAEALRQAGFDPLSAPPVVDVGMSDFELATRRLTREFPETPRDQIMLTLGRDGLDVWRDRIEEERQLVLADLQRAADVQHSESPEGRRAAAQAAADSQLKRANDVRLARLLIVDEGQLSEADAALLSDAEALTAAGFVAKDASFFDGADSYAANLAAAEKSGGLA